MNLIASDCTATRQPRLAIFGTGGLGTEMVRLLAKRPGHRLVGLVDQGGYAFDSGGFELQSTAAQLAAGQPVAKLPSGKAKISESIREFCVQHAEQVDGIFLALPNLPNEFIPSVARQIAVESAFNGVIADALKRTSAVEQLVKQQQVFEETGVLYLAGCGATPGMLSTAAQLAAQSFVEIKSVKITFGVGIANWQAYRATIREDIAHLPGYDVKAAAALTEHQVDELLAQTGGLLHLENMEHADDIMLELAGVCAREQVTVGGIVDTRNPQKPISTNVQITGVTYQGRESTHTFTLGDETTMAANVNGSVLGFLNAGLQLHYGAGISGLLTAADLLPRFQAPLLSVSTDQEPAIVAPQMIG